MDFRGATLRFTGWAVERAMEGRPGAAVAEKVSTGEILAALGMEVAAHRLVRPGSTVNEPLHSNFLTPKISARALKINSEL
jgi:hypothetical protein